MAKIIQDGADPDPVTNGSQGDGIPEEAYCPEVAKVATRPLRQANRPWPPESDPEAERRSPTCPVTKCRNQVGNATWSKRDKTASGRPVRRRMCQCHVCGHTWEIEVIEE